MGSYTTIRDTAVAEITEKKSRFIGHAAHAADEEEALAFLASVRSEHRTARHNVYAYVLREGGRARYSDDGEPQKTAGLPTLEAINHAGITDAIVVVTRYFGGILLGTGGLVRAYTAAARAVLDAAEKVKISSCVTLNMRIPYALYDQLSRFAANNRDSVKVVSADFSDEVLVEVLAPSDSHAELLEKMRELLRGQGSIAASDPHDAIF